MQHMNFKSVIHIPTYVRACITCNERGIDSQVVSIQRWLTIIMELRLCMGSPIIVANML